MDDKTYSIIIKKDEINVDHEIKSLRLDNRRNLNKKIGAIATFIGSVRDINENNEIYSMFLEHYPEMTEKSIYRIVQKAFSRWKILNIRWMYFFFSLALLNEIVWRTQSEEFWVNFKVWGLLPITFIFTAFQIKLINKYKTNE